MSQEWKIVWYDYLFLNRHKNFTMLSIVIFSPQTHCQRNTNSKIPFTSLATDCLRWSYNSINETCTLFGHSNKSLQQKVMEVSYETDLNYHSGFRYCGTSCYFIGRRQNFHGDNTLSRINTESVTECQVKCQQEAACEYWVYNAAREHCYLKWKVESGPIEIWKYYFHGEKHCPKSMGM